MQEHHVGGEPGLFLAQLNRVIKICNLIVINLYCNSVILKPSELSSPLVTLCVDDLQGQGEFCELQERLWVDIICLDFQKAFDKAPHEKIFKKLGFHGTGGEVLLWFEVW